MPSLAAPNRLLNDSSRMLGGLLNKMCSFQETTRIEYRLTGFTRIITLFFAGLIFPVGIVSCYLFTTPPFSSIPGVALAMFIVALGIYFAATVLRSRVLIEGTRIKVRNAFGEKTADLTEIEGVRNIYGKYGKYGGSVTGKRLYLKAGQGTITVSMMLLDLDDRFSDWLKQLPDLDKRDQ
jgi:hypothetical protein